MKRFATISLCVLAGLCIRAQKRPETGAWLALQMPVRLSHSLQWHNDAGYRTLGTSPVPHQYLYRTGIRYHFNPALNATAGVAVFFTRTTFEKTNSEFGHEFRLWEEINHHLRLKKNTVWQIRFRTEQRFFDATRTTDNHTAYRFRLRSGITLEFDKNWSVQLADEYMQQHAFRKIRFDQNRVQVYGIYHLKESAQLQLGYMWLKWPESSQHILIVSFQKNFSLHGE